MTYWGIRGSGNPTYDNYVEFCKRLGIAPMTLEQWLLSQ